MTVQEITALAIVGLTGGLFLWRLVRRHRRGGALPCCGCSGGGGQGKPPPNILLRARRKGPVAEGFRGGPEKVASGP